MGEEKGTTPPRGVVMEIGRVGHVREGSQSELGTKPRPPRSVAVEIERKREVGEAVTWGDVDQSEGEEGSHARRAALLWRLSGRGGREDHVRRREPMTAGSAIT